MQWDFNDLRRRVAARLADGPLAEDDAEQGAVYEYFLKIVNAMTVDERANPDLLLDRPTRERIAHDAGVSLAEVDALIAQRQVWATFSAKFPDED